MNEISSKKAALTLVGIAVTAPVSYIIFKKMKRYILKQTIQKIQCYGSKNSITSNIKMKDPPNILKIKIGIMDDENVKKHFDEIESLAKKYKLMAVDCEWVQKSSIDIALLQLSFPNGRCFLLQHYIVTKKILKLLEDPDILKIGVGILDEDVKRFKLQWNIAPQGLVDLRYLVKKYNPNIKKLGVQSLTQNYLNLDLDKDWRIRASNWESETFTHRQIEYAANDVLTVMAVCLTIIFQNNSEVYQFDDLLSKTMEECTIFKDVRFNFKSKSPSPPKSTLTTSTDAAAATITNNQPKIVKNGNSQATLKKNLYDNARLEAPDGQLLCYCDSKKAMWYVQTIGKDGKRLGEEVVNGSKLTVRLNFEPAGRPKGQAGDYYLTAKDNICVVCGKDEGCLRKYIVPHEYRKLFPDVMRDHQSHDVLLMCLNCHQRSNTMDFIMRKTLGEICNSPWDEMILKTSENLELKSVRSAGRALFKDKQNKIPEDRKQFLRQIISDHFQKDSLTNDDIKEAANVDPRIENENYVSHAESVVTFFRENDGILKLEKMWRQHFLDVMKPKYLPANWSIDHQENRLTIRQEENRVDPEDLDLAHGNFKSSTE